MSQLHCYTDHKDKADTQNFEGTEKAACYTRSGRAFTDNDGEESTELKGMAPPVDEEQSRATKWCSDAVSGSAPRRTDPKEDAQRVKRDEAAAVVSDVSLNHRQKKKEMTYKYEMKKTVEEPAHNSGTASSSQGPTGEIFFGESAYADLEWEVGYAHDRYCDEDAYVGEGDSDLEDQTDPGREFQCALACGDQEQIDVLELKMELLQTCKALIDMEGILDEEDSEKVNIMTQLLQRAMTCGDASSSNLQELSKTFHAVVTPILLENGLIVNAEEEWWCDPSDASSSEGGKESNSDNDNLS